MLRTWLGVGVVLALCGCKDDPVGPPSQLGQFGAVNFLYGCDAAADAVCDTQCDEEDNAELCAGKTFEEGAIPIIARDSTFLVTAEETGVELISASDSRLELVDGAWVAHREGITAILAESPDLSIKDLVDIRVMPVEAVDVDFRATYNQAGDNFLGTARIVLLGEEETPLGGSLPCEWTTSDAAIVNITSDATDNTIDFETGSPGTATLTVTLGDHTGSVEIEVGS